MPSDPGALYDLVSLIMFLILPGVTTESVTWAGVSLIRSMVFCTVLPIYGFIKLVWCGGTMQVLSRLCLLFQMFL